MTRARIVGGMLLAVFAAGLAILYRFSPSQYSFYPRCPIYLTTHWLCPGCGGTRAMHELLHTNWRGALHYNALLTVLAPVAVLWFAYFCYEALRYGRLPALQLPRLAIVALGIVVVLFTVVRNTGIAFVI